MIRNINDEKDFINEFIANGLREIVYKGLKFNDNIGNVEDEINTLLRALQFKNKIYDYACNIEFNDLIGQFEGTIVYDLVNTKENTYSETIKFNFR